MVTLANMARQHPDPQPPFPSHFCSSLAWHLALGQVPDQLMHWCRAELGGAGGFRDIRMGFPSDGLSSGEELSILASVPETRTFLGEVKLSTA